MKKKLFNEYIYELVSKKTYDFLMLYDFDFAEQIKFPECSKIIRNLKVDLEERFEYKTNFSTTISYKYDNLFFDEIELELILKEEESYLDTPCELIDVEWKDDRISKIKLRLKSVMICVSNFVTIRHSLFIAYYKYLYKIDKENVFVQFVEYAAQIAKIKTIDESVFRACDKIATYRQDILINGYTTLDSSMIIVA